ncbi:SIMPL domain-containing protein [Gemmatimonas sp.]|uniref:SIMPL domain-containing protein n=1 Tax=Gemmatimonas sp. TaxID=1962908 RepID=UPI0039833990
MTNRLSIEAVRPLTAAALVFGALVAPALATRAAAQMSMPQPPPQIVVTGRGEVLVAPDRAQVQVGMETQAKTAAIASQENNRKQTAILASIRALGVPAAQIQTLNYSVMPIQRYDEKSQRVVIDGYRVSNIVQVETDKIEQAGPIIDAALTNGGNRVAGLDFLVKDRAKAQETALTKAVESARRQAEVAAKAAGGQVAELLELNINEYERPQPRAVMAMAKMETADASAPTPVSEGMTTIAVSVTTRWRFTK